MEPFRRFPIVKPSGLVDGHPGFFETRSVRVLRKKIVEAVQANPTLWANTAIFITEDEGGGYYDSGYVQPLDFFGDGTRIPSSLRYPHLQGKATLPTSTPITCR